MCLVKDQYRALVYCIFVICLYVINMKEMLTSVNCTYWLWCCTMWHQLRSVSCQHIEKPVSLHSNQSEILTKLRNCTRKRCAGQIIIHRLPRDICKKSCMNYWVLFFKHSSRSSSRISHSESTETVSFGDNNLRHLTPPLPDPSVQHLCVSLPVFASSKSSWWQTVSHWDLRLPGWAIWQQHSTQRSGQLVPI